MDLFFFVCEREVRHRCGYNIGWVTVLYIPFNTLSVSLRLLFRFWPAQSSFNALPETWINHQGRNSTMTPSIVSFMNSVFLNDEYNGKWHSLQPSVPIHDINQWLQLVQFSKWWRHLLEQPVLNSLVALEHCFKLWRLIRWIIHWTWLKIPRFPSFINALHSLLSHNARWSGHPNSFVGMGESVRALSWDDWSVEGGVYPSSILRRLVFCDIGMTFAGLLWCWGGFRAYSIHLTIIAALPIDNMIKRGPVWHRIADDSDLISVNNQLCLLLKHQTKAWMFPTILTPPHIDTVVVLVEQSQQAADDSDRPTGRRVTSFHCSEFASRSCTFSFNVLYLILIFKCASSSSKLDTYHRTCFLSIFRSPNFFSVCTSFTV